MHVVQPRRKAPWEGSPPPHPPPPHTPPHPQNPGNVAVSWPPCAFKLEPNIKLYKSARHLPEVEVWPLDTSTASCVMPQQDSWTTEVWKRHVPMGLMETCKGNAAASLSSMHCSSNG